MNYLRQSIKNGFRQLAGRRIYLAMMIVLPIAVALFFLSLLKSGLPTPVPTAIVDLDNSSMSRNLTHQLRGNQYVDVRLNLNSYAQALERVNSGDIMGFYLIPPRFESDAIGGRHPVVSYYCNMAYFVPASLTYKGFKTTSVTTSGSIVRTSLLSVGMDADLAGTLLQPIVIQDHPLANPYLSYSIYLCNSFVPGVLALVIMLITVFSIWEDIKRERSRKWLDDAGGSITIAVVGKLLPQTIIFAIVGFAIQSLFYGYASFPLNGSLCAMLSAMFLFVIANQAFGFILAALIPNMRLALSIASLISVISFSIAGFSFPVESMHSWLSALSFIPPIRYYFLIYADVALNGFSVAYSRLYFIALLVYPLVALAFLPRMKTIARRQLYTP